METHASMFADDSSISCTGTSPEEIENKINEINKWLERNKLTLNANKTEYILIASKRKLKQYSQDLHILLGNHSINQVTNKRVLEVTIDEELKWNQHTDAQCKTLSRSMALLRRARTYIPQDALIHMFNGLVLPHFVYCLTVWNDGNRAHIDKLYKMQNRAARGQLLVLIIR